MTITTTQQIIKIGSSAGVTIPAKQLKQLGGAVGDKVRISFEKVEETPNDDTVAFVALTQKLLKRHEQALKNLADR
ncbi:MAG: hypothetical protein ACK5MU_01360 [Candidatus Saccharimonadales bacterium]